MSAISLKTISILFIDKLAFLARKNSIYEGATSLDKTGETILKKELSNAVIYNITKIKAILFSRACGKKAKKEVVAIKLVFEKQEVKFNNIVTR